MSAGLPDRYAVVERVGADACFESYKVIDRADGCQKLLHAAPVGYGKTAALTRMAARLPDCTRHNRVCVVFDSGCGKTHSMLWLVTEYLAGAVRLGDLLCHRTFDLDDALTIGADVASGLSYLKTHEILYSTLTPSEVLVWHQPGHGIRAKIDRVWVPYLSSELTAQQTGRAETSAECGSSAATVANAFRRVWTALCARTRPAAADTYHVGSFRRATELTHSGADITDISDLFLRLVRADTGPQLVSAETVGDADIDEVLSLDEGTLEREYQAAACSDLPAAHIIREIASRVFVQNAGTVTDVLRSAMNAAAEERMPEQLSLLNLSEEANAGPKLLLVDSEEDRSSRHSRLLQAEGFIIETTASPIKAVDMLNAKTFDAVAVWLSSNDATQDGAVRELLRCNNILPVLSVFPSTDEADLLRVLARVTRIDVHRRYRKRVSRADGRSAELPFLLGSTPKALDG